MNEEAAKLLSSDLEWNKNNLGPKHHQTALIEGFLAIANSGLSQVKSAKEHYESAVQNFTSPEALTGDFNETALHRKQKRYIFQNYSKLLAKSAATNPQDAETLFKIADQLKFSSYYSSRLKLSHPALHQKILSIMDM